MTPEQVDFWAYMDALFRIVSGGYRDPMIGEDGRVYVIPKGGDHTDRISAEEAGIDYWQICDRCMNIAMGKIPEMDALQATLQDWIREGEAYEGSETGDCEHCGLPGAVRWFPAHYRDLCLTCFMKIGR